MKKTVLAVLIAMTAIPAFADVTAQLAELQKLVPAGTRDGKVSEVNPKYPNSVPKGADCTITATYSKGAANIVISGRDAFGGPLDYSALTQPSDSSLVIDVGSNAAGDTVFTIRSHASWTDEDGRHSGTSTQVVSVGQDRSVDVSNTFACRPK